MPSCQSRRTIERKTFEGAARLNIEPEQYQRFKKYLVYRDRFTLYIGLPPGATAEEIRSRVAGRLEVPKHSTWEMLLTNKTISSLLTDERRARFSVMFGLSTNATWIELKDHLEDLRERNR